jgi:NDP-sugar pyrophosphorylase family protein
MKAMILAAGMGTRLRPLTDDRPKALVELAGRTLLEIAVTRLRSLGIKDVIVNVHHFAEMMSEYLESNGNFGMRIEISREEHLLDTGGGLKKAAHFFLENANDLSEPLLLHNVDVISNIDIRGMLRLHTERGALATLAVQSRRTSRYLLFDESGLLRGRRSADESGSSLNSSPPRMYPLAFCGIHVLSPALLTQMSEQGPFSIIDTYLRLAAGGEKILAFRADQYYWRDLGRPENLAQAALDVEQNRINL